MLTSANLPHAADLCKITTLHLKIEYFILIYLISLLRSIVELEVESCRPSDVEFYHTDLLVTLRVHWQPELNNYKRLKLDALKRRKSALMSQSVSQSVSGTLDRPRVVATYKTCGHVRSSRRRWR